MYVLATTTTATVCAGEPERCGAAGGKVPCAEVTATDWTADIDTFVIYYFWD